MSRAWVRGVPDSFDRAIVGSRGRAPDVALASQQHAGYVKTLVASGLEVTEIQADHNHPDCVFIEDAAVLIGSIAVITRPGAADRRGELPAVADALSNWFEVETLQPPATLDGGDVMVIGRTVFVGLSERTNREGLDQLASIAALQGYSTTPVVVKSVLHLKSGVLPVSDDTIVVTPGTVDEDIFDDFRIVHEDSSERHRFSALPLADRLLVTESAPRTSERLDLLGFGTVPIDVSEILAADGGLTCMSIIGA